MVDQLADRHPAEHIAPAKSSESIHGVIRLAIDAHQSGDGLAAPRDCDCLAGCDVVDQAIELGSGGAGTNRSHDIILGVSGSGPKDRLDEARSPDTTPEPLDELANFPYNFVLTAVAAHPNATSSTLARSVPIQLATAPDQELVKALSWNPQTDTETLVRIAERLASRLDNGRGNTVAFEAGIALFSRFDTPLPVLERLLEGASMEFRKVVARQSGRADVVEILERDRSLRVRRALRS